ncbi:alkyl hydroperoxide reductase [Chryseobacterium sp. MA9]|uniref:alkyl hydroperoxide reductase n=1 Tax=Chryseobacterium sp. MA9 TaxID=2966625 RepID=UPI002102B332|nr:alkyl hydroperoxide reductase [Chryseobacterium sp. MA9]UTX48908.1 alkyl hydroperoxide reductase [Chryseobacterium sp. MA9]
MDITNIIILNIFNDINMNNSKTESIKMYFSGLSGKTYYFVIYQGENCITISQGIIPENERIIINISKKFNNYKGMGRLLIYDHACEVAGLDIYISGENCSIHCKSIQWPKENIIYRNTKENEKLNELSQMHNRIVDRYLSMQMAVFAFSKEDENYSIFNTERIKQKKLYESFQIQLGKNNDYVSKFLQIENVSRGQGTQLLECENEKARNNADWITNDLDWNVLYTSGRWMAVIDLWIRLHTTVLKDEKRFDNDYKMISLKLESKLYHSFRNRTLYNLKNYQLGEEKWYKILSKYKFDK